MMQADGEVPETLELADAALTEVQPDDDVAEPAPAEEPAAEGQPRDADGRFASPAEAAEAADPEVPADALPPRDEPTEAAVDGETASDEDFPEATFEVDGQEVSLSGTAVGEDGVFVSPETWAQDIAPQLAAARQLSGSYRARMSEAAQQVQQAQAESQAAKSESQHVLSHFETLIERSQAALVSGNLETMLQSPLGQWLLAVGQNWPILKAEARVKAIETSSQQATKRLEEYTQRDREAQLQPLIEQSLRASVAQHAQAMGVDEQTMQAVFRELNAPEMREIVTTKAPFDDPNLQFKRGELVLNHGVVAKALQLASINRVERAQQEKIAQAQRQNQALQPVRRKVPPTVGAKGRSPGGPAVPQPKSAKEADDLLLNGNLDWAEEEVGT